MKKISAIAALMIGLWMGSALKCGFPCVVGGIPSFFDILGLGGVPQASWLDCNGTCLLAAIGNTAGRVFKFNEDYCTLEEVLDENGYGDVLSGLGSEPQVSWLDCNGTCLLAAIGLNEGRVFKFNEGDCTLSEVTGANLTGLGSFSQVSWLDCSGTCLLAAVGQTTGRVFKFNEYDCTLDEVETNVLSGLGNLPQVSWLDCYDTCLLAAIGEGVSFIGTGRVFKFNENTCTLEEVLDENGYGDVLFGLGRTPQVSWLDCNGTCLLAAIAETTGRVLKFNEDVCTLSEVTGGNVSGLGFATQASWLDCNGTCLLAAVGQTAGRAFKFNEYDCTLEELGTNLLSGLGSRPQVSWLDCNGTCLLAAVGSITGRVYKFNEYDCTLEEVGTNMLSGLGSFPQVSWLNCSGTCLLAAIGNTVGRVFVFNELDCTLEQVGIDALSNPGNNSQVSWLDCNETCLLVAVGSNEGQAFKVFDIPALIGDCFYVDSSATEALSLTANDCGCIDESSIVLTDTNGSPLTNPTSAGGTIAPLSGSGTISYTAPVVNVVTTDTFFYTANDCDGIFIGSAPVSVVIIPSASVDCDCNLAIELELTCVSSGYDGSIVVTVDPDSGSGYDFTVTLDGGDAMIAEAPYYQVTYPGLTSGTYSVKVVDNGQTQCMATGIVDIEECAQPSSSCGTCSTNVTVVRQ